MHFRTKYFNKSSKKMPLHKPVAFFEKIQAIISLQVVVVLS